jgi:hypothetical protein
VAWTRAALALVAAGAVALAVVSGGSSADPRTPAGLPGLPPPFLGTAVVGDGGLTAAIDAYGDVVDLRAPGPAGRALIDNPAERQAAGTVAGDTGIVPRVRVAGGPGLPLWRADSVSQRYRPGTNVLVTRARFGSSGVKLVYAARGAQLACLARSTSGAGVLVDLDDSSAVKRAICNTDLARSIVRSATASDRRWLARARPLGRSAPRWARRMYARSLLTLRALTDRDTGAVAAGARDGWAYVWPRDAGTAALAYAAAGYPAEARRVAHFLLGLDLGAAARFHGNGTAVPGRGPQGDASGWVAIAARIAALSPPDTVPAWRDRADYQERSSGDFLANAIVAREPVPAFKSPAGLTREAHSSGGLDSAAAWAVRPYPRPALFGAVRRTLLRLAANGTRFGIAPSEDWPGADPWTAPTAWTAWSLAALGERRQAMRLIADIRRAATPAGTLPERVDARSGVPRSTTPLAWSHAFALLALRQIWAN